MPEVRTQPGKRGVQPGRRRFAGVERGEPHSASHQPSPASPASVSAAAIRLPERKHIGRARVPSSRSCADPAGASPCSSRSRTRSSRAGRPRARSARSAWRGILTARPIIDAQWTRSSSATCASKCGSAIHHSASSTCAQIGLARSRHRLAGRNGVRERPRRRHDRLRAGRAADQGACREAGISGWWRRSPSALRACCSTTSARRG